MSEAEPASQVEGGAWRDLGPRVGSAVVMTAGAGAALWAGGLVWVLLVSALICIGFWELAGLCVPGLPPKRRLLAGALPVIGFGIFALVLGLAMELSPPPAPGQFALLPVWTGPGLIGGVGLGLLCVLGGGAWLVGARRWTWAGYGLLLLVAGGALLLVRENWEARGALYLIGIVVISDVAGYFAGRALGGPKFWPAISPKKTWSGTAAGWIGAAVFGAVAGPTLLLGYPYPVLTPLFGALLAALIAFAGQMGDILESAMKRRAGVKDSSALIPGHGGVLDRLDALVAAAAFIGTLILIYRL